MRIPVEVDAGLTRAHHPDRYFWKGGKTHRVDWIEVEAVAGGFTTVAVAHAACGEVLEHPMFDDPETALAPADKCGRCFHERA